MRRSIVLAVACSALAFGGAIVAAACSSDSGEATPSRPPVTPPGADGATDGGSSGGEGGADAACTGEAGCFACEPVQDLDFLNECTDGLCTPFDNVARLPLYKQGQSLPAIP